MKKSDLSYAIEFLSDFNILTNNTKKSQMDFIEKVSARCNKREEILIENNYDVDGFNIFKTVADDRYKKELFHSNILRQILDPKTPKIGNIRYINQFVEFLQQENQNIEPHIFSKNVIVKCEKTDKTGAEKGRIDIFIYDDTHGIIIENKINNAKDEDDQLARYLKIAKKEIAVIAIVYIPLYERKPSLDDYRGKYKKLVPEIEKKLVVLPAKKLGDYLDICVADSEKELQRVYLKEYSNLVKYLGGKNMAEGIDKELLLGILSNKENVVAAKNLVEIWEKRTDLLSGIFKDELNLEDYDKGHVVKKINDFISSAIWVESDDDKTPLIAIGFTYEDKTPKIMQTKLKELMDNKDFTEKFGKLDSNSSAVFRYFSGDVCDGSFDKTKKLIIDTYKNLESEAKKVLSSDQ